MSDQPQSIVLDASLNNSAVMTLKGAIAEYAGKPLSLDASNVSMLGGLCAQVLVSASRKWNEDGNGFAIENATDEFVSDLTHLGFSIEQLNNGNGQ